MERRRGFSDDELRTLAGLHVDLPMDFDQETLRRIIHDLRAAATAFKILVEEYDSQIGKNPDPLRNLKRIQLWDHAQRNAAAIDQIVKCLGQTLKLRGLS